MSNLYKLYQIKSAGLEGTRPGLLKMMGNFASQNPYLVGGLGLGAGLLGLRSLTRGKDDDGPGLMGTLGTLGLLGGGGYLLDRLGGIGGIQRGFQAYNKFGDSAKGTPLSKKFELGKFFYGLEPKQQQSLIDNPTNFAIRNPRITMDFAQKHPNVFTSAVNKELPQMSTFKNFIPNFVTRKENPGTEFSQAPSGSQLVTEGYGGPGQVQYSTLPPAPPPQNTVASK